MAQIRILVADDHELVRRGIVAVLATQADFHVVSEAATGVEAITKAGQFQPDVVLLDISMPALNGLAAIPVIKECAPQAHIIIVTDFDSAAFSRQAFAAGARAFVPKAHVARKLVTAVREVVASEKRLDEQLKEVTEMLPDSRPPSAAQND